jgi:hypothetical protein
MALIQRDNNEILYNNIFWLVKDGALSFDYYEQLIRNARALFISMKKDDLIKELNQKIKEEIEDKTGHKINEIYIQYKNMAYLNRFIKHPRNPEIKINKIMMKEMFNVIEEWIFIQLRDLAKEIRFSMLPKQTI